jgi:hypothetical protein
MTKNFWSLLKEYKVVIPILQRDYAQGRMTGKVPLIRNTILNAICEAIQQQKTLELDFIYGNTNLSTLDQNDEKKVFNPLDGQQRLTTLYLFHWYIAAKEDHLDEETIRVLENFTYHTRHSSRVFCSKLVSYHPECFDQSIKQSIMNQPWFFTAWKNDPTIDSMLTMLDAIQKKVRDYNLENIWNYLVSENAPIVFHLLPMDKLGIPDDLYIKMNSRGKELTEFEYFKSRFTEIIPTKDLQEMFNQNIDQAWSDLFWDLYKDEIEPDIALKVDAAFLRFFRYITDIILAKKNLTIQATIDEFEMVKQVYSEEDNVDYLFSILNTFVQINKSRPDYFSSVFYIEPSDYLISKTRLFFGSPSIDLFRKCSNSFNTAERINPFSIGEQLMLYACIVNLLENTTDFNHRIRKVRNLISKSEDTVRKENMTSLLQSIDELIMYGKLNEASRFNKTQIKEEEEKALFIEQYVQMDDTVYRLEDHHLLEGCISILPLSYELPDLATQFHQVFSIGCDYDEISCALLTFGDYAQQVNGTKKFGNKNHSSWRELFTPSQRRGNFHHTQRILYKLLKEFNNMPGLTIESIILDYLKNNSVKEKDWRYYFIKYPKFRKHEDGFYYWPDPSKPYECFMLRRKTLGGFHWDPYLATIDKVLGFEVSLDNYGHPLLYLKGNSTVKITNHNDRFTFDAFNEDGKALLDAAMKAGLISSEATYVIQQSAAGLDDEDRVQKGIDIIRAFQQILI